MTASISQNDTYILNDIRCHCSTKAVHVIGNDETTGQYRPVAPDLTRVGVVGKSMIRSVKVLSTLWSRKEWDNGTNPMLLDNNTPPRSKGIVDTVL